MTLFRKLQISVSRRTSFFNFHCTETKYETYTCKITSVKVTSLSFRVTTILFIRLNKTTNDIDLKFKIYKIRSGKFYRRFYRLLTPDVNLCN